jgi:hypothetical protein
VIRTGLNFFLSMEMKEKKDLKPGDQVLSSASGKG